MTVRAQFGILFGLALLFPSLQAASQPPTIDLAKFGYTKTYSGRYTVPAFASLSYVGEDALFITFPMDRKFASYGQPFNYVALVLSRAGMQIGRAEISGTYDDVLQRRINLQPLSNVLARVRDQLRIYSLDLATYRSIDLAPDPQLRVPPDRKTVVVISKDGNKAMNRITAISDLQTHVDHLDFDERAVRDGLLAVSNEGSVAHAVSDPGAELAVHSWSLRWPEFQIGKYQKPMAFIQNDELLVNAMETTPFSPTKMYLWKADGTSRKVRGSEAGFYTSAKSSLDGKRVLVTQTNVSFFGAMLGGFDCGDCGESYYYSIVDASSAKVILKHRQNWNCTEALSPSGKELAELCDGTVRFYPVPN